MSHLVIICQRNFEYFKKFDEIGIIEIFSFNFRALPHEAVIDEKNKSI